MTTDGPRSVPVERFLLRAVGRTDVGAQRTQNEDAMYYDDFLGVYVVCDGMGGHASGQVASDIAIRTIVHALKTGDPMPAPGQDPLVAAMKAANAAVYQRSRRACGRSPAHHPQAGRGSRRFLVDIEREICGVGHGDAAILAGQPEPAGPRHSRLAAAIRCDLRTACPQPPVPVAEPGPPLAGDPQPQLRPGPVPRHEQHATPAP